MMRCSARLVGEVEKHGALQWQPQCNTPNPVCLSLAGPR